MLTSVVVRPRLELLAVPRARSAECARCLRGRNSRAAARCTSTRIMGVSCCWRCSSSHIFCVALRSSQSSNSRLRCKPERIGIAHCTTSATLSTSACTNSARSCASTKPLRPLESGPMPFDRDGILWGCFTLWQRLCQLLVSC